MTDAPIDWFRLGLVVLCLLNQVSDKKIPPCGVVFEVGLGADGLERPGIPGGIALFVAVGTIEAAGAEKVKEADDHPVEVEEAFTFVGVQFGQLREVLHHLGKGVLDVDEAALEVLDEFGREEVGNPSPLGVGVFAVS